MVRIMAALRTQAAATWRWRLIRPMLRATKGNSLRAWRGSGPLGAVAIPHVGRWQKAGVRAVGWAPSPPPAHQSASTASASAGQARPTRAPRGGSAAPPPLGSETRSVAVPASSRTRQVESSPR